MIYRLFMDFIDTRQTELQSPHLPRDRRLTEKNAIPF